MTLTNLESAFRNMLTTIAEKGGKNVELKLDGSPQYFKITAPDGSRTPAEEFCVLSDSSGQPIVSYTLWDRSRLLQFPRYCVPSAESLQGINPTPRNLHILNQFVGSIIATARKNPDGPVSIQRHYHPNNVPTFVAFFAERTIPGL